MRVADMIAYVGKDRYDAIELGVVDSLDAFESDYLGRDNARIINNLVQKTDGTMAANENGGQMAPVSCFMAADYSAGTATRSLTSAIGCFRSASISFGTT